MNKKTLRKRNKVINAKNKHSIKHQRIKRKGKRLTRKQCGGLLFNFNKWDPALTIPVQISNFKQFTPGVILFKLEKKTDKPDTKTPYIILEATMQPTIANKRSIQLIIQLIKKVSGGLTGNVSNLTGEPSLTGPTGRPVIISEEDIKKCGQIHC